MSLTPSSRTMLSKRGLAGRVLFFVEVAPCQIAPSGACTNPT